MDDFTKEELEMIRDDLDHEISTYRMADNTFNRNMRNKTQRMIDNYCDHVYPGGSGGNDLNPVIKCNKCGHPWENPKTDFTLPDGNQVIVYVLGGGGGQKSE